jgi:hypothetical protein
MQIFTPQEKSFNFWVNEMFVIYILLFLATVAANHHRKQANTLVKIYVGETQLAL